MDLEEMLDGEKVKIYYDGHIVDKTYASSNTIDTIKGDE